MLKIAVCDDEKLHLENTGAMLDQYAADRNVEMMAESFSNPSALLDRIEAGVHYCIEEGLMIGLPGNLFAPSGITTRAQIVTILWRLEGSPMVEDAEAFDDVYANEWYYNAIRWASANRIAEGYGEGFFGPNDTITREQMATILWRYCKYKGIDVSVGENTNILSYEDAFAVSSWAMEAMQWACGSGLLQGNGVNLSPRADATRAQAAALLQRFCENVLK